MKKTLLDVLFKSEKRKNVLLLLQDGPMGVELIINSLGTTRQSLLPQLKILVQHHLISKKDDTYELTTIGKHIVEEMVPVLGICEVLDSDINYWGMHHLDFIPPHLLNRMSDLGECEIIKPHPTSIYTLDTKTFLANCSSRCSRLIYSFHHTDMPAIFSQMVQHNVSTYLIVTQPVLDKMRTDYYSDFAELIESNLFNLFVYPKELGFIALVCNDYNVLMCLLGTDENHDFIRVKSYTTSAIVWAKELFEWYLKDSVPITEL